MGLLQSLCVLSLPENLSADADECGALVDGDVPVVGHTHGELGERLMIDN